MDLAEQVRKLTRLLLAIIAAGEGEVEIGPEALARVDMAEEITLVERYTTEGRVVLSAGAKTSVYRIFPKRNSPEAVRREQEHFSPEMRGDGRSLLFPEAVAPRPVSTAAADNERLLKIENEQIKRRIVANYKRDLEEKQAAEKEAQEKYR